MRRSYKLKQRAEQQHETRQRIVEAAVHLHGTLGPAHTSMKDIAELAQVGRQTLYRHFPDLDTLFGACSGLYLERNPLPDAEKWCSVSGLLSRFEIGLTETYAYHRQTADMMSRVLAEIGTHPIMSPYHAYWQRAADIIAEAASSGDQDGMVRAAAGHALRFSTWQSLVEEEGLTDRQAISMMLKLVPDSSC